MEDDDLNKDWDFGMAGQGGLNVAVDLFGKKILHDKLVEVQDYKTKLANENKNFQAKILQQKIDQADIYEYLNTKLQDNYVQIAELESKILDEQTDREAEEDAFEEKIEKLKHSLVHDVAKLKSDVCDLKSEIDTLITFQINEKKHFDNLKMREKELEDFKKKNEEDYRALDSASTLQAELISKATSNKIEETRKRFQEESVRQLSHKTRKQMAENEQIQTELVYQDHEIARLVEMNQQVLKENQSLSSQLHATQNTEEALAKTSRYFQHLILRMQSELEEQTAALQPETPDGPLLSARDMRALKELRASSKRMQDEFSAIADSITAAKSRAEQLEDGYARLVGAQADLIKLLGWQFDECSGQAVMCHSDDEEIPASRPVSDIGAMSRSFPARIQNLSPRKATSPDLEIWPRDVLIPRDVDELNPRQKRMVLRMLLTKLNGYQNLLKDELCRVPIPRNHPFAPAPAHRFPSIKPNALASAPLPGVASLSFSPRSPLGKASPSPVTKGRDFSIESVITLGTRVTGIPSWDGYQPSIPHTKGVRTRDKATQTMVPAIYNMVESSPTQVCEQEKLPASHAYRKVTLFRVEEDDPVTSQKSIPAIRSNKIKSPEVLRMTKGTKVLAQTNFVSKNKSSESRFQY